MVGMALAGLTRGRLSLGGEPRPVAGTEEFFARKIAAAEVRRIVGECRAKGTSSHDALMDASGWPAIPFDGQLLFSQQDALLVGGKVQAPAGFADHVQFRRRDLCEACDVKLCIEMCSGQAIAPGSGGVPAFDREKCVYCGACVWNCPHAAIAFQAGAGGLHSTEN
jgi:electron-transferring-flavoprotein dehydrogenase